MRKDIIFMLIGLLLCVVSFSQKSATDSSCNCREIMEKISYYWKLDSLASNGFRLYVYEKFLTCNRNNVNRASILDKLGTPNLIWKTNKGHEYVYYYYDGSKDLRQKKGGLAECLYISFQFGIYDKFLSSVEEGLLDK